MLSNALLGDSDCGSKNIKAINEILIINLLNDGIFLHWFDNILRQIEWPSHLIVIIA